MGFIKDAFGAGGVDPIDGVNNIRSQSSGFDLNSINQDGVISTNLTPKNTIFQQQNEASFADFFKNLPGLRERFASQNSDFRNAGLDALGNAGRQARSNISSQLRRRSILGSNFGRAELAQNRLEQGQREAEFTSQAAAQELANELTLRGVEQQLNQTQFQRELAEVGLSSSQGQALASLVQQNEQFNAQLEQSNQASEGAFFGTIAGSILDPLQSGDKFGNFGGQLGGGQGGGQTGGGLGSDMFGFFSKIFGGGQGGGGLNQGAAGGFGKSFGVLDL